MSQTQGGRRRRGRGKPNRSRAAEFQARNDSDVEDRGTFWARSNARLGFEAVSTGGKGRPRQAVELNCAVCGIGVLVERVPKNRHEVRCADCRSALGGLMQGDERDIADEMNRANRTGRGRRREGLPTLTEEDREAIADMRARQELGNGRVGNRRRSGGGGGGGGRRRRGGGGGRSGGGNRGGSNRGGGGNRGGGNRGGGGGGGNRGGGRNGNHNGNQGGGEQGNGEGRRRRRRRRRGGDGGGSGGGNPAGGGESPPTGGGAPSGNGGE